MGLVKNQHTRSFNSRSPSGLRHLFAKHRYKFTCFNSRSPSGLRHNFACLLLSFSVSIHAAQAGCDGQTVTVTSTLISFNSRSPSGLRPSCRIYRRAIGCFNSRSPSGLRRLLQRYNKKEILSKDKSRKSLLVIIIDVEDKAIELELTDNQTLRNSNKIMFT